MKSKLNQAYHANEKMYKTERYRKNSDNLTLKSVTSREDITFPMKPFEGTRAHLNKGKSYKETYKPLIDSVNDRSLKSNKLLAQDPLELMGKLEKFSDVWNDNAVIENLPKKYNDECPINVSGNKIKIKPISVRNEDNIPLHKLKSYENTEGLISNNKRIIDRKRKHSYNEKYLVNSTCQKEVNCEEMEENSKNNLKIYDAKLSDIKRKKALQGQRQLHADQKNIIKEALSTLDKRQKINKRVVFSDAENEEYNRIEVKDKSEDKDKEINPTTTKQLFDDDLSGSDVELNINSHFEGKKGQKLLELQSKFASDSRFTLDSRFYENESESDEEGETLTSYTDEKKKQLAILESIVKQPIRSLSEMKKEKLKTRNEEKWMIRFDPTKEDHQKYILKVEEPTNKYLNIKEKKKKEKRDDTSNINVDNQQDNKPKTSNEKVYAVKEDLKKVLKKEIKTEFSLLKLFGPKDENSTTEQSQNESMKKMKYLTKNPFKYDSSESENESEEKNLVKAVNEISECKTLVPSWKTSFFMMENDSRLQEGLEFLKESEETEDCLDYAEKRKVLKDFIRHKFKNNSRKKTIFKKKLGGLRRKFNQKKTRN